MIAYGRIRLASVASAMWNRRWRQSGSGSSSHADSTMVNRCSALFPSRFVNFGNLYHFGRFVLVAFSWFESRPLFVTVNSRVNIGPISSWFHCWFNYDAAVYDWGKFFDSPHNVADDCCEITGNDRRKKRSFLRTSSAPLALKLGGKSGRLWGG